MRTIITSPAFCSGARRFGAPLTLMVLLGTGLPAGAQTESFILKPGSKVGPATKVKATDCVTQPDGTVTCNTKLVNPSGDTPAKPSYSPFKN